MSKGGKRVIAILTDSSFYIKDISVPINFVSEVIKLNQDAVFVYGMCKRIDSNIEKYLDIYRIPKENRIKFEYNPDNKISIAKDFLKVIANLPDAVYIFRDYANSDTNTLINECRMRNIKVVAINSDNEINIIDKMTIGNNGKIYYKNKGGN